MVRSSTAVMMRSKSMVGAFLALLSMASGQTFTVCDPTKKGEYPS